jgi:uncharacterized protein DUF6364
MNDARLTIRVPQHLLEEAREYARENQTTLTRLVSHYLRQLAAARDPLADAPIIRRLSGSLSPAASMEDYRKHLDKKYTSDA